MAIMLMLWKFGLEGAKWPPDSFAKYLKNGSANLHQTL